MPYTYKLEKGEYCVYKKDSGEKVGCTDGNKESLKKYLGALHMNERKKLTAEQKLRKLIRNEIRGILKEGGDLTKLNNLEDYVYDNESEIRDNLKHYGFKVKDLRKMQNYMDLSNVLGVDSRIFKGADIKYYGEYIAGLLGGF